MNWWASGVSGKPEALREVKRASGVFADDAAHLQVRKKYDRDGRRGWT
jgi:predicted secreted protein